MKSRVIWILAAILLVAAACWPVGGDPADCTSTPSTNASVDSAIRNATAGDVICIREGSYELRVTDVQLSGTPQAPIVIRNYPDEVPVLTNEPNRWVFKFVQSSHVEIYGLKFEGRDLTDDPSDDDVGSALFFWESDHITIRNLWVQNFGGGSITAQRTAPVTIMDSLVQHSNQSNCSQVSGLNVHTPQMAPGIVYGPGYEVVVSGNAVFESSNQRTPEDPWHQLQTQDAWYPSTCDSAATWAGNQVTDGNCVIIDLAGEWIGDALVDSNTCEHNGGRGVAITDSDNVTITNNVLTENLQPTPIHSPGGTDAVAGGGEISIFDSDNVTYSGNTITPLPGVPPIHID